MCEKFVSGFQGVVEDHCGDDDKAVEFKQHLAEMDVTGVATGSC